MCRSYAVIASAWVTVVAGLAVGAAELEFNFEESNLGVIPSGFRSVLGGKGTPGDWEIIATEVTPILAPLTSKAAAVKRRVLAQLSEDITDERFPILLYEDQEFGDFEFSARFKIVGGAFEQMAGLVFRALDANNYYYVRASSLGNSFRFFKVVNGLRSDPIGVDVKISRGEWHTLSIECQGNQIKCFFNGEQKIPTISDISFSSGKIGFWTKSDSVAYFADSRVVFKPRETPPQTLIHDVLRDYPRFIEIWIFATENGSDGPLKVIAASDRGLLNTPGGDVERNVIDRAAVYFGNARNRATVTMPLRDRNGEPIAAVRFVMKSFRGQTEKNAIARVAPIRKLMEERLRSAKNLVE
ncbi:MAG: DUF1080 domain-containing protein [Verrucomicrobia bacterium]|nr:DUF1080 domain-containing protein [Verrucomicrobiota bacterium]